MGAKRHSEESDRWEKEPLEWPRAVGGVDLLMTALEVRKRRRRRRNLLAGATVLLAVAGGWLLAVNRWQAAPAAVASSTAGSARVVVVTPERRVLPDGSVVELRAGSELAVDFTAGAAGSRHVTLASGEAHFQVAKNPARPFVVSAEGVEFRAVGTAFAVGVENSSVEMVVTEGRVAVQNVATKPAAGGVEVIAAGSRVQVAADPTLPFQVSPLSEAEMAEELAWRSPRLECNEAPLAEVVRLLDLYSGRRVRLGGSELAGVEISGSMVADNPDPLLQLLKETYQIGHETLSDGEIVLRHETKAEAVPRP